MADPFITMGDLRRAFAGASEDDLRTLAEPLAQFVYANLNARIQGDVRDDRKIRWLASGADITTTAAGAQAKYAGESYSDKVNLLPGGGTPYWSADPNQRQLNIPTGGGGAADCAYDYWVSSCFSTLPGYTAGMAITTFSGCTVRGYATLYGASGAFQAALATGATKAIFMCNSESTSATESLDSLVTGQFIFIEGVGGEGADRNTLTSTVTMFNGLPTAYWTGKGVNTAGIVFSKLNITVSGNSLYLVAPTADGLNRPAKFIFNDCGLSIAGTSSALYTNASGRPTIDFDLNRCTGTVTQLYHYNNGGIQSEFGTLTMRDCVLTIDTLFTQKGSAAGYSIPTFLWYDCDITISSAQQYYGEDSLFFQWVWARVRITYNVANSTCIKFGAGGLTNGIGDCRMALDVVFNSTATNTGLFNFDGTNAGGPTAALLLLDVVAYSTSNTQNTALITASSNLTGVRLGAILAPQWGTLYSGPAATGTASLQKAGLTGAIAYSRYAGATTSGAPVSGTFAIGDFIIDQAGKIWICTVAGSPGTWVSLISGAAPAVVGGGYGAIPGMDGLDGDDGMIGPPGPTGARGATGATGASGSGSGGGGVGPPGFDGEDGMDGMVITLNHRPAHADVVVAGMKQTIVLTAGGGRACTTAGCAGPTQIEATTNKRDVFVLDFDSTTAEKAFWDIAMPANYDGGTVTAIFHWLANDATTNGVQWGLQGTASGDGATFDTAYGTAQEVLDNNASTANQIRISAATPAITLAGSPAGGQTVTFRAYRDPANGSDTLAVDARLLKIVISYGINALSA